MTKHKSVGRFVAVVAASAVLALTGCTAPADDVTIGLITKQETNPYWVEMRNIAEQQARRADASLIAATGTSDTDVEAQLQAMREMIAADVDGILIAPTDSTALNGAIAEAREADIAVIAVDTPTNPENVTNAFFGTDNFEAGELVGRYAAAKIAERGVEPKVAILDLAPGIASGEHRRAGFLAGFGIAEGAPELVASENTEGDRARGEAAMKSILAATPDINVVFTVNEEAAVGAVAALKVANVDLDDIVIVSVDGGCVAIKGPVRDREIDATAQQYPQNMARLGVDAIIAKAREGVAPSGFLNTGVELISGNPVDGVDSRNVEFGVRNCWG